MSRQKKRDPAVDPKPGDVLVKKGLERHVCMPQHQVYPGRVLCATYDECWQYRRLIAPTLSQWRKWSKGAKVIYAAK